MEPMETAEGENTREKERRRERLVLLGALALGLGLLYLTGIGCPFRFLLGVPCPGCGITRACQAVLHLDFAGAFYYHPLFWLLPPAFVYVILGKTPLLGSRERERFFLGGLIGLTLAVYVFRLIFAQNEAFTVDISAGFIVRLWGMLQSFL